MLKRYRHYPIQKAELDFKAGMRKRYKITTLNWTYGTLKGEKDYTKVHKNTYVWTLKYLVKFIRETEEVAEDVIEIKPI